MPRASHSHRLASALLSALLVASCGKGVLPSAGPTGGATSASGNVSLTIEIPPPKPEASSLRVRSVRLLDIASVDVRASRPGSRQEILGSPNPVPITWDYANNRPNNATSTLSLPVGPNQIVTVTALGKTGKPLPGGVMKGLVTVTANTNATLTVSSATTPAARAVEILAAMNPTLAAQVSASQLQALVNQITGNPPYATKPSQIDPQAIADAIAATRAVPAAPTAAMTLSPGTVTVHVVNAQNGQPVNGAAVVVGDPMSSKGTTDANGDATIANVAPGRWTVTAGGALVPVTVGEAYVLPGQTRAADPQPTVYQPQQLPTSSAVQMIGPEGGTVSIPGVLDLAIPANAIASPRRVRLTAYANADPTRLYAWRIDPQDLRFNTPASLTFHYTDQQLATWGIAEPSKPGALVMAQYQTVPGGTLPRQVVMPASFNVAARTMTTRLAQTGAAANAGQLTVQASTRVTVTPSQTRTSAGQSVGLALALDGEPLGPGESLGAMLWGPGVGDSAAPLGTDPAAMLVTIGEKLDVGAELELTFSPYEREFVAPTPSPTPDPTLPTPGPDGNAKDLGNGAGSTGALDCGPNMVAGYVAQDGEIVQVGPAVQVHASNGTPAKARFVQTLSNLYPYKNGVITAEITDSCGALVPDGTAVAVATGFPTGGGTHYTAAGRINVTVGGAAWDKMGQSLSVNVLDASTSIGVLGVTSATLHFIHEQNGLTQGYPANLYPGAQTGFILKNFNGDATDSAGNRMAEGLPVRWEDLNGHAQMTADPYSACGNCDPVTPGTDVVWSYTSEWQQPTGNGSTRMNIAPSRGINATATMALVIQAGGSTTTANITKRIFEEAQVYIRTHPYVSDGLGTNGTYMTFPQTGDPARYFIRVTQINGDQPDGAGHHFPYTTYSTSIGWSGLSFCGHLTATTEGRTWLGTGSENGGAPIGTSEECRYGWIREDPSHANGYAEFTAWRTADYTPGSAAMTIQTPQTLIIRSLSASQQ